MRRCRLSLVWPRSPRPHQGTVKVGPLTIHLYGLTLLVAIAACIWITGRRWMARGGDWDLIYRCALWGVAAGIVGPPLPPRHELERGARPKWKGAFEIWHGGLGVWGGIAAGVLVGGAVARRAGATCPADGLRRAGPARRPGRRSARELVEPGAVRQAHDLPWGLEIDLSHRVSPYFDPGTTFHPAFLYELLWNLVAAGLLIWIGRRFKIRPPGLFALYVTFYCFGRFWIELLRIDRRTTSPV